jgi:DNA-binding transcriptional LysR family regulator
MELRQVRYFVAVARERNFGRAAEELRIAQSGLSQQIMALERSLGVQLFDRTIRPIRLTPEGEVFLEQARLILELADRTVEQVRGISRERRTALKFGGSAFGNPPTIDALLRTARTRLRDVNLQIHLDIAAHNLAALNRRELDVMFSYVPFESEETPRYLRLGWIELALALPAGHRLAVSRRIARDELFDEPFLAGPKAANPPLADHVYLSLFGQTDPPNPVHLNDVGGRFRLVAEGAGITPVAVPTETLIPRPGVVYRRLEDPAPTIEYGLLWFDDHVSPGLAALLRLARDIAREESDQTVGPALEELVDLDRG